MMENATQDFSLEAHHVDPVPASERSGHARDLFSLWFSANLNVGNAVFGLVIFTIVPNFWLALAATLIGNVIGTALMALHSVQGARLGIPQLIQSRGQFGYFGALVPVIAAALMYAGFTVSVTIVGGQALAAATDMNLRVAMLIVALTSFVIAVVGYHAIHTVCRWAQYPLTAVLLIVTVAALLHDGAPVTTNQSVSIGAFLTAVGVAVTFALTYAPFVSDYSRYLPANTSGRAIFGWTAAGVFLSAVWVCLLGLLLTAKFGASDIFQSANVALGGGALSAVVLILTAAGLAVTNVLNVYGGMLNLITGLATFVRVTVSFRTRILMILPTFVIGTAVATVAYQNYAENLGAFLSLLLLILIPWGAVNLVDYYLVQHGTYDVPAMYVKSGPYWYNPATWTYHGFNLKVLLAYFAGVLSGFPFVSSAWFKGPLADRLDGADLSWIPGLAVTAVVYLALAYRSRTTTVAPSQFAPVTPDPAAL
jgi:NCS1 family nucleobase:cation symporter-1